MTASADELRAYQALARVGRADRAHLLDPEPRHRRPDAPRASTTGLRRRLAAHRRHQALRRRLDGLGHGGVLRAVHRRPVDDGPADPHAGGAASRRSSTPTPRAFRSSSTRLATARTPSSSTSLEQLQQERGRTRSAPAHRARAGRPRRRQGAVPRCRRHRVDPAEPLHRRHALGRSSGSDASASKIAYNFKSFVDAGARIAFGTDWFVEPMNPMLGLYAAVTRQFPDGTPAGRLVPRGAASPSIRRSSSTRSARPMPSSPSADKGSLSEGNWRIWSLLSQRHLRDSRRARSSTTTPGLHHRRRAHRLRAEVSSLPRQPSR